MCDEQFGPVVPVTAFDTDDEAIERANEGELGLGASVWSADEARAFDVAARLEAGFTFVNTHNRTGMAPRAPFGGVKKSGFGREYGDEGLQGVPADLRRQRAGRVPPRRRRRLRDRVPRPGLTLELLRGASVRSHRARADPDDPVTTRRRLDAKRGRPLGDRRFAA